MFAELLAFLVFGVIVAGLAFAGWRWFGRSRPSTLNRNSAPTTSPVDLLSPFGQALQRDAAGGRQDAVLRRLDRELPEWPASSTLIEAVRELFALEADLKVARVAEVPETITGPPGQGNRRYRQGTLAASRPPCSAGESTRYM